jgi:hypothetical protein
MRMSLFPSTPNTRRVRELKNFFWDVEVSAGRLLLGFHDQPAMAEIRLVREPESSQWLGDVLTLSEKGEFVIAVNRGLVASVEAERLVLAEENLDRDRRVVRMPGPGGHFLCCFEWGDELSYRKAKEGRVGVSSPGADWPLMLFTAWGPTPALAESEMDRLKSTDLGAVVAATNSFGNAGPRLRMTEPIDELWEHVHQLHRVNTYEPEPPFIFEWECPTRTDPYASRVVGHWDTLHTVWDWLLTDPTRARQEFENYLKGYDPATSQMALDVAPIAEEDLWPKGRRRESDGRCMVSSHPPVWPEIAWKLYLATGDQSWLGVTYEVARLNIAWWERERDRDRDGFFESADTRFPQPWESGCDGSPRFDRISSVPFPCVDLNAQLVMFYRNLVRFAVELGEPEAAAEYSQKQDRLGHLVREKLWDADCGWFFDRGEEGLVRVRTTAGLWTLCAGLATREQLDAMIARIEDPRQFATWFPLPSVAADEPTFAQTGWRGPARPSQVLWFAMGLRGLGQVELAGRLVGRALDRMAEVLGKDGAVYECYNPHGPDQSALSLFDFSGRRDPVRRYYLGQAPVRAMVLSGLLGVEPVREGLAVHPARESLPKDVLVDFVLGKQTCTLETHKGREGIEIVLRCGRKTVAESLDRMLVPRAKLP